MSKRGDGMSGMGGGGGGSGIVSQRGGAGNGLTLPSNPALNLGHAKITQRAEDDFRATYKEAREHAENNLKNSRDLEFSMQNFYQSEDAPVHSLITLKGIQAKINSTRNNVTMSAKLGVIDAKTATIRHAALNALQRALNKEYDFYKEIRKK